MNRLRSLAVLVVVLTFAAIYCRASDIYIAQAAAGGNTGADCVDAHAMTFFNTSSNWASTATSGKISPGTTVHLCGTFTASGGTSEYLVFQGSGTSGNPITLLFQNGAVLTSPYWSGGVIDIGGQSNVVVNGGTNGLIQATDNGTNLDNQQDNGACVIGHDPGVAYNVTVENLTCANLYIDASVADNGGEDTYGVDIWDTSNLVEQNNTLHDMKWAIRVSYQTGYTYSNITVTGNNIYDMDHGVFVGDNNASGSAVMSGFYIYGNTVGSMTNWDNALDNNHHDWLHLHTSSPATRFTNFYLYNNYGNGDVGAYANAGFFFDPASTTSETGLYIFNNVLVNSSTNHCWANGSISADQAGTLLAANNTFVSQATSCKDNGIIYEGESTGITIYNNIIQNTAGAAIYVTSGGIVTASNYNDYYESPSWFYGGTWYSTLPSWIAGTVFDSQSTMGNPKLTGAYHLGGNTTSAAWQTAQNLYSTCNGQANPGLGALCLDKAGITRQGTGPWDMGAYEDSVSAPPSPTGVSGSAVLQ